MRALRARAARLQHGAAVLVLLALLGIVLPMMLAASHRPPRPEELARQRSHLALLTARDALIARAIKGRRDSFSSHDEPDYRPGSLPCPDVDNDGSADGSNCFAYLGRLPYKTLELDDLRDGMGERLWYALSPNFRPALYPLGDTRAQLRLQPSGEDIVALLFAPGGVLANQSRHCAQGTSARHCAQAGAVNYLEGRNAVGLDTAAAAHSPVVFETRAESARTDTTFNDLVLPLTSAMFMPAVARRIAAEAARCLLENNDARREATLSGQPFPGARHWLPGNSPCGGTSPHAYFDVWRPHLRYRLDAQNRLLVHAPQASVCLDRTGLPC